MTEEIKKSLDELKRIVKEYTPEKEEKIKEMVKEIYIEIANAAKALSQAQDELRKIVFELKIKKTSKEDAGRFYAFLKAKTSAELDIATLLDRAWNLIVVEENDEAIKVLKEVLEIEPKNVRGLGLLGLALMNKELYDEAMLYFQKVLTIEPNNPFALNNLGFICYKKGIWGEAIEHLTKVLKQQKDRTACLYANYYLGLVYLERGMLSDAVRFFEEALKIGPNLQEAYYYLGMAELKRYEFKKAVEYFDKCIKIDKSSKYAQLAEEESAKIKPIIEPEKIMRKK
uniref:Tetratricopeptide repeat protein n=1 Tax=candidate division WOR-3 bacterium TaxID=2052148 RepID=A0A7C4TCR8_UNCW3